MNKEIAIKGLAIAAALTAAAVGALKGGREIRARRIKKRASRAMTVSYEEV